MDILCRAHTQWYLGGGRRVEEELLEEEAAHLHIASRFQAVVRTGLDTERDNGG